ncbi:hypothetical protein ACFODQ_00935 [Comamonas sp. JC664]
MFKEIAHINTIYCNDEALTVLLQPIDQSHKCPAIVRCLAVHESIHWGDAFSSNPEICKGNKGKSGVGAGSHEDWMRSEEKAFNAQLRCLERSLKESYCDEYCKKWIEMEISNIKNIYLPKLCEEHIQNEKVF